MTSQGSLRHQFQRALERGNTLDAIAAAKSMGQLSLGDALALTVALADEPTRYNRMAVRWLGRFMVEGSGVTLEEAQLTLAALLALPASRKSALPVLRELVERRRLVTVQAVFVT